MLIPGLPIPFGNDVAGLRERNRQRRLTKSWVAAVAKRIATRDGVVTG